MTILGKGYFSFVGRGDINNEVDNFLDMENEEVLYRYW